MGLRLMERALGATRVGFAFCGVALNAHHPGGPGPHIAEFAVDAFAPNAVCVGRALEKRRWPCV